MTKISYAQLPVSSTGSSSGLLLLSSSHCSHTVRDREGPPWAQVSPPEYLMPTPRLGLVESKRRKEVEVAVGPRVDPRRWHMSLLGTRHREEVIDTWKAGAGPQLEPSPGVGPAWAPPGAWATHGGV